MAFRTRPPRRPMSASIDSLDVSRLRAGYPSGALRPRDLVAAVPQVALGYALFGAVCLAASMQGDKTPA